MADMGIPAGAFIYLNAITSSHINLLISADAKFVGALSEYGMTALDMKIRNHLLRPKAEGLARTV